MKILFVCLGNICRSPLAEGIMLHKVKERKLDFEIDSAGTGAWHVGEHPDHRAIAVAKKHGVDLSKLIARKFSANDFQDFDKIFVMDRSNHQEVIRLAKNADEKNKVDLLLNIYLQEKNNEVPDPYYGGDEDFENVFQLLDSACDKLIEELLK